ncbi:MAG: SAM-dependent methyltransferase [Bacteroidota bacterium]|nr:SAM-dependent methyltransferase [Bacteroidota bacterium]
MCNQQDIFASDKQYFFVNGNTMKKNEDNILDQFFTNKEVAKELYNKTNKIISKYENIKDFVWIEPSAGDGVFYDLFPKEKRIGVDIAPLRKEFIKSDFLDYSLPKARCIVMGNPPFGHRGVMALEFINHAEKAEYVCFILPMFFNSKGKGSIKYRVKGFNLIFSESLPSNTFYSYTTKKSKDVKCVFQIWSKNHRVENNEYSWYNNNGKEPFNDIIKVVTVSLAKKRECGKRWIFDEKADFYLSSTFFDNITPVYSFEEVKYKSGIAIILLTQDESLRKKVSNIITSANWKEYATLATNSCYHLGKSNVFQLLNDKLKL